MRSRTLFALAAVALFVAAGCTTAPVAGELTVNLTTPNTDDGALLVRIRGSGAELVTNASAACSGCKMFKAVVSDTEIRAVITGAINAGAVARVSVSDVNNAASYAVDILDVASRTYVKRATTGYSLSLQ
jgi:uncharacterized protein (DUF2141 family)